jgi:hypothetical protein
LLSSKIPEKKKPEPPANLLKQDLREFLSMVIATGLGVLLYLIWILNEFLTMPRQLHSHCIDAAD